MASPAGRVSRPDRVAEVTDEGDATRPRVGILGGTGPLGRGIGFRLAAAGYDVVLGSRSPERADRAAAEVRDAHGIDAARLRGAPNRTAASRDLVLVAVPFDGVRPLLTELADVLDGSVVVSCVNRLGFDADGPHPIPVPEGSAAELVASLVPGADVHGGFHHLPAAKLSRDLAPLDMDVLITGGAPHPYVCDAVEALGGVRAIVAGPLRLTRPVEELTAALIAVNKRYGVSAGVRMAGVPD